MYGSYKGRKELDPSSRCYLTKKKKMFVGLPGKEKEIINATMS